MPEKRLSARYPTDLPAWRSLKAHFRDARQFSMHQLFADDPQRFERFTVESGDLLLDYSKNLITAETRDLLLKLGDEAGVVDAIEAMFAGEHINVTEDRPVLHVALRSEISDQVALETPGVREVWQTLDQVDQFVNGVHGGSIRGTSGEMLTEIVNIGIGGSDLGPVMASRALRHHWLPGVNFHSVSNVDGTQLGDLSKTLNPAKTLFVICSKTFTTQETMTNAQAARRWIVDTLGADAVSQHFAAASTNHAAMNEFGINANFRFGFWDWVGGRYSLWSAIGLSLALVIGMDNFRRLLAGGRRMDRHFRQAQPAENVPMLLGLISVWYNNFFGAESQAILPYDNRLDRFPAYLQQLQMESSGKSVRRDGRSVTVKTGMVVWGEAGSNAQHSFYQLLHQGTRFVPADFILPARSSGASAQQQDLAIVNCLAQSEALMEGYESEDHFRVHDGNRPSNMIVFESLTPEVLGQLVALYEHKVFVENVIWGTNAFDQFGVELGKKLARRLEESVSGTHTSTVDNASTAGLIATVRRLRAP
jgi:glucose-6-phosphate isomerase